MGVRTVYSIVPGISPAAGRVLLQRALAIFPLPMRHPRRPGDPPLVRGEREHSALFYDDGLLMYDNAWQIAAEIARLADKPTIELRVQEGDHWDFTLYRSGQVVADFSTRVRYFDETMPPNAWKQGDLASFASAWGVAPELVAPYLVDWDALDAPRKASPGDRCETGDFSQIYDFMRVLGIPEPHTHPDLFTFRVGEWVTAPRA